MRNSSAANPRIAGSPLSNYGKCNVPGPGKRTKSCHLRPGFESKVVQIALLKFDEERTEKIPMGCLNGIQLNYLQLKFHRIFVGKSIGTDALWNVFCLY